MLDHPLHPVFVHFAVALSFTAIATYFLAFLLSSIKLRNELGIVSLWLVFFAFIASLFTVTTGFLQFSSVHHDAVSHIAMVSHRNWAIGTSIMLFLCFILAIRNYFKGKTHSSPLTIGLVILSSLLGITAYKGGNLVYNYGLGVKSNPALRELQKQSVQKQQHDAIFQMDSDGHKHKH